MKKSLCFLLWLFFMVPAGVSFGETVAVDGHAYLENESNNSGIKVIFERKAPSALYDSTYTDTEGYYSIEIEQGIYDISFSKEKYYGDSIENYNLYSETTLPDITLKSIPEKTTLLQVPSVFSSIQKAINLAVNGDTVLVATGIYYENINFIGKNITVASHFLTTNDTTYISNTIIDADKNGRVVTFNSGEGQSAQLIGFTISNGNLTLHPSFLYPENCGGGILLYNADPSITSVIIKDN